MLMSMKPSKILLKNMHHSGSCHQSFGLPSSNLGSQSMIEGRTVKTDVSNTCNTYVYIQRMVVNWFRTFKLLVFVSVMKIYSSSMARTEFQLKKHSLDPLL